MYVCVYLCFLLASLTDKIEDPHNTTQQFGYNWIERLKYTHTHIHTYIYKYNGIKLINSPIIAIKNIETIEMNSGPDFSVVASDLIMMKKMYSEKKNAAWCDVVFQINSSIYIYIMVNS